jgi:hypothetical protein
MLWCNFRVAYLARVTLGYSVVQKVDVNRYDGT